MNRTVTITDNRLGRSGPRIELPLPITASPNRVRTILAGIPSIAFAVLGLFAFSGLPTVLTSQPMPDNLLAATALLVVVTFGASLASTFYTAMRDLSIEQPVVIIDETGILDRRVLDRPIRWDEIASVTSYRKVNGGILLELSQPLPVKFNLFRIGTLFHFWKAPERGAYISMNWLIGPFFPAAAVFALAYKNNIPLFERRKLGGTAPMRLPDPD